uniref:YozE_SAM_like domain-containing protein n=1 Tax=Gongylonema pulchrum TaxID=637853 RepID=A0A183DME1_9BILA
LYLFEGIVQYTNDNRSPFHVNAEDACRIMTNSSEPSHMKRIKQVFDLYNSYYEKEQQCNDNSYSKFMEELGNAKYDKWDIGS